ncbi:MAG: DUF2520 domain-containing protein [Saprospiraceae bacterium]|nr:DUF2520 domain-containing protein [Saprospiraceae bacterium]
MNITIVGSGNVAFTLARGLQKVPDVSVLQILSRNRRSGEQLADMLSCSYSNDAADLHMNTDLCLLCVGDSAITRLAQQLPTFASCLYAHTSGTVPSTALAQFAHFGVFYPLQTLSKERHIEWNSIPVLITGNDPASTSALSVLATKLGSPTSKIADEQRLVVHLAAVISNNFSTALTAVGAEILKAEGLDPVLLHPLLKEGVAKICELGALKAQTGPAIRQDLTTMDRHLALLKDDEQLQGLYRDLSALILRLHQRRD